LLAAAGEEMVLRAQPTSAACTLADCQRPIDTVVAETDGRRRRRKVRGRTYTANRGHFLAGEHGDQLANTPKTKDEKAESSTDPKTIYYSFSSVGGPELGDASECRGAEHKLNNQNWA